MNSSLQRLFILKVKVLISKFSKRQHHNRLYTSEEIYQTHMVLSKNEVQFFNPFCLCIYQRYLKGDIRETFWNIYIFLLFNWKNFFYLLTKLLDSDKNYKLSTWSYNWKWNPYVYFHFVINFRYSYVVIDFSTLKSLIWIKHS